MNDIRLVSDPVDSATGAVVYWRLNTAGTNYPQLVKAWEAATGLPDALLLTTPTPKVALRRAVKAQATPTRFVRSAGSKLVIVDEESDGNGSLSHHSSCTVSLDLIRRIVVEPHDHPLAEEIEDAYVAALDTVTETDFSGWLASRVMPWLDATRMRDTGGIYFIPRGRMADWTQVRDVFESVTRHVMFELPAMNTSDTVDAVFDAIAREAEAVCAEISTDLDNGLCQSRAFSSRKKKCADMAAKVQRYEALLGRSLTTLSGQLTNLQSTIVEAELAAEMEGDDD